MPNSNTLNLNKAYLIQGWPKLKMGHGQKKLGLSIDKKISILKKSNIFLYIWVLKLGSFVIVQFTLLIIFMIRTLTSCKKNQIAMI